MEIIDISDLNGIVNRTNLNSIKQQEFIYNFIGEVFFKKLFDKPIELLSLRILLDNLSNQIRARCSIVRNRLITGKRDEEYEKDIIVKSIAWQQCGSMNPKYDLSRDKQKNLVERITKFKDKLFLKFISDLPFIKPEYSLKNIKDSSSCLNCKKSMFGETKYLAINEGFICLNCHPIITFPKKKE